MPYGWKFPGEEIHIPSHRGRRLNIFGMVDYKSIYHGFTTELSITAKRIVSHLDIFSFQIKKATFIVLDNAKVHRNKLIEKMRAIWEKRGLYLFFLPPYSPHLNIVESVWRLLKGKWIQPGDYETPDMLFYAVNRALAALGTTEKINFSKFT